MGEYLTFDNIMTLFGLISSGGLGVFFSWRYLKRKAKAEAEKAEAEAKAAEAESESAAAIAAKEMQDMYQQLIIDIKADRDEKNEYIATLKDDRRHLRQEREELRERQDKLEETVRGLQRDVARNGRMVEVMRPFLCGRSKCPDRVPVTISDDGEIRKSRRGTKSVDIEPLNDL